WTGTTIGASSSRSATFRPPKQKNATMPSLRHPPWRR
ncbi:MAG: Mobile element protein, partial [uncultured Chloroflexia bacterium]